MAKCLFIRYQMSKHVWNLTEKKCCFGVDPGSMSAVFPQKRLCLMNEANTLYTVL